MNARDKKAILYVGGILASAILAFLSFWQAIFYAWMNANGSWPPEKVAPWAYGTLAVSFTFFVLFVYFIGKVIKIAKGEECAIARGWAQALGS